MIKIDFQYQTEFGKFADAIHLPEDHTLTEQEIIAMQEKRRDDWIAFIKTASETATDETLPPVVDEVDTIEINGVLYKRA